MMSLPDALYFLRDRSYFCLPFDDVKYLFFATLYVSVVSYCFLFCFVEGFALKRALRSFAFADVLLRRVASFPQ